MEAYLESMVKPLLSKPESFKVTKTTDNMGVLLSLDVSLEDVAHVIGKGGQNISAVRRLVGMYGMRNDAKISVRVNEPVGGKKHQS